jgi:hypothetical protein
MAPPKPPVDPNAPPAKGLEAQPPVAVDVGPPKKCCSCCECCEFCSFCTMCICANKGDYTDGLAQQKTPTDCICLVIYMVCMAFALYGMFYGLTYGDIRNIGQPYDRDGNSN